MSDQGFSFEASSLRTMDLLPPDEDDLDADVQWLDYCAEAAKVNRQHVLECVLSDLDANDSPLFEFIDDAIQCPHEPGRPKANLMDLARLGKAVLMLIAPSVDEEVNLRLMVQEVGR
jgi:hypothetical protein